MLASILQREREKEREREQMERDRGKRERERRVLDSRIFCILMCLFFLFIYIKFGGGNSRLCRELYLPVIDSANRDVV